MPHASELAVQIAPLNLPFYRYSFHSISTEMRLPIHVFWLAYQRIGQVRWMKTNCTHLRCSARFCSLHSYIFGHWSMRCNETSAEVKHFLQESNINRLTINIINIIRIQKRERDNSSDMLWCGHYMLVSCNEVVLDQKPETLKDFATFAPSRFRLCHCLRCYRSRWISLLTWLSSSLLSIESMWSCCFRCSTPVVFVIIITLVNHLWLSDMLISLLDCRYYYGYCQNHRCLPLIKLCWSRLAMSYISFLLSSFVTRHQCPSW